MRGEGGGGGGDAEGGEGRGEGGVVVAVARYSNLTKVDLDPPVCCSIFV